jgi:curved DNA-binding protein CbpA
VATFYETLGLNPSASPEVVAAAYRALSKKFHPDINPSADAGEAFKRIQAAYEVLIDPLRRANYDATIESSKAATFRSAPSSHAYQSDAIGTQAHPATGPKYTWNSATQSRSPDSRVRGLLITLMLVWLVALVPIAGVAVPAGRGDLALLAIVLFAVFARIVSGRYGAPR